MIAAANASPYWMSCGFSSLPPCAETLAPSAESPGTWESGPPTWPSSPNSGSTKLTAGSFPSAQSRRNSAEGTMLAGYFPMIDGMIAVAGRSVK